jgi:HEAT repeat protein
MNNFRFKLALGFIVGMTTLGGAIFAQQTTMHTKQASTERVDINQQIEALQSADNTKRLAAICSLRERKDAGEAIAFLVKIIGDETPVNTCGGDAEPMASTFPVAGRSSLGREAAKTLAAMGKPAVEPVITASRDGNWKVRNNAVWALGEIRASYVKGQEPRTVSLLARLQDEQVEVRRTAAWALAEIKDTESVQLLIVALNDEDSEVRKNAAWALGEMKSGNAVESLIAKLQDQQWEVRKNSAWALGEIKNPSAIEPLTAALKDEREEVRNASAFALREMRHSRKNNTTSP